MNAEIIGVGTELLLGQIANTNAQSISARLAGAGIDVYRHTAIGDNPGRARDAIAEALARADVVIVTGGLGPTPDDLTREAAAAALGQPLVRDESVAEQLRAFFEARGRSFPEENLRQADRPAGSTIIPPKGTAPGFYAELDSSLLVAIPGVPWEMEAMMTETVLPLLRRRSGGGITLSREILVIGLGESHVHEQIADLVAAQTNPTIAYLAGGGRVRVRITAKAADSSEAETLIDPVQAEISRRLGPAVAGEGDSVAAILGRLLIARKQRVAAAESMTGGLVGAALTAAEGSSDFFVGSLVCYTTEAKRSVAGVDPAILENHGAVSGDAAAALARSAATTFGVALGLATTGVAGPAKQEGKPVGTIFVAAYYEGRTEVRRVQGYGNRENMRAIAVTSAIDLGRRMLVGDR